jgi:GT2 family glycosyltransferase
VKSLGSLAALRLPGSVDWEVLVVDNNSSDNTSQVAKGFCSRYPGRFRCVFEPRQGLSHARNTGVREARGEILAFTDDDVTVDVAWLQHLTANLHGLEWAGAAGRIIPNFASAIPNWLRLEGRYALAPFVAFDLGPNAGELTEAPFGANMAFRKEVFERFGGFRGDLGRTAGDIMVGGEDSEFGVRLLAAGERLRYEPSAIVYHPVSTDRLQKKYLLGWSFGSGVTSVRLYGIRPGGKYFISGIPLCVYRSLAVWTIRWVIAIEQSWRFECKRNVWKKAGELLEMYRQSRYAKPARQT